MDAVWVIVALVALAVIVAVTVAFARRRRTNELREGFGPEYDRTVQQTDDRHAAESELLARRERVEGLEIRPLEETARVRYAAEWNDVQAHFVDDPRKAVVRADELVELVMRDRGYPMDDFEQRAADVSVGHPRVVDHYRAGHAISDRAGADRADTEELRQGFVHYRELFSELLDER